MNLPSLLICVFLTLAVSPALAGTDCDQLSEKSLSEGARIEQSHRSGTVSGQGRLHFFSAPAAACDMPGVFILPAEKVQALVDFEGYRYVEYVHPRTGAITRGWVDRTRVQTGEVAPPPRKKAQVSGRNPPESAPALQRQSTSQNCRPRTQSIRCQSSCVNGDCVVKYENGCRIRVQVNPVMDPFSGQFTFPAPSC